MLTKKKNTKTTKKGNCKSVYVLTHQEIPSQERNEILRLLRGKSKEVDRAIRTPDSTPAAPKSWLVVKTSN